MGYRYPRENEIVREFKYRYHEPRLVEVQKPARIMEPPSYYHRPQWRGPWRGGYGGYWRWRRENENRRFMWYVVIIVLLVASFLMLATLALSQGGQQTTY